MIGSCATIATLAGGTVAAAAGGTPLPPGGSVFPVLIASGTDPGTLLADESGTFDYAESGSDKSSGTYEEAVYEETGGDLTFYLQLSNDSGSSAPVTDAYLSDFETVSTSVGYRVDGSTFAGPGFVDGTVPPTAADRNASPGDTVAWHFSSMATTGIAPGSISNLVEISTDATTFSAGRLSIRGDGIAEGLAGFQPAAPPISISTTANPSTGPTGSTLQDSATLANASSFDGTASITFDLYGPGDANCSASPVYTTTVSDINGDGPWSTTTGNNTAGYAATGAGTYQWTAGFTGDSHNAAASTRCGDEPVTITASPGIATTATPSTGPAGSTLQDSATLTSASNLDGTGSITFDLYAPGDTACASPVHSETVNDISSDGPFSTTTGYAATVIGTYNWTASFSGDSNNAKASTSCGAEPVVITRAGISQITPTSATCSQFAGLTAHTLAQVTYSLKSGKVKNADPDAFLDWVKVTSTGGTQTFTVTQSVNETSRFFMLASGSTAYTASCAKVSVTTTQSNGRVTVKFNGGSAGATYYIALKYSTSNVIGETGPSPNPKVEYTFATAGVAGSQRELDLVS